VGWGRRARRPAARRAGSFREGPRAGRWFIGVPVGCCVIDIRRVAQEPSGTGNWPY
jgi:hypothetical protein